MYHIFSKNRFFDQEIKEDLLKNMEDAILSTGNAYGEYKRPEHLYL